MEIGQDVCFYVVHAPLHENAAGTHYGVPINCKFWTGKILSIDGSYVKVEARPIPSDPSLASSFSSHTVRKSDCFRSSQECYENMMARIEGR